MHIDAGFPPSGLSPDGQELVWDTSDGTIVSRLTVLLFLIIDLVGGETNFYAPCSMAVYAANSSSRSVSDQSILTLVCPVTGACLMFPQAVGAEGVEYARMYWPRHEGSPVVSGSRPKYISRSDVLFATTIPTFIEN